MCNRWIARHQEGRTVGRGRQVWCLGFGHRLEKRLDLTHGVNLLDRVLATPGSGGSLVGRAGCDKVRRWEYWGVGERWQGNHFTSVSGPPSVSRDQRISVLKCDTQRLNVLYKFVANI